MKRFWLPTILTTVMFCGSLPVGIARQLHGRDTSKNTPPSDDVFLQHAIEANTAEIELGRMAQSKSQNPRVQKFAAMLVQDYSNALDRLNRVTGGGVSPLPNRDTNGSPADTANSATACEDGKHAAQKHFSKEYQQICRRLAKLSGAAFDREYINSMVQEIQKTLEEFEQRAWSDSDSNTDSNAKSIARELLPALRTHLKQAESLQRQFAPVDINRR